MLNLHAGRFSVPAVPDPAGKPGPLRTEGRIASGFALAESPLLHAGGAFCHLVFSVARPATRRYERVKIPDGTLGAAFRERRWQREMGQPEAPAGCSRV